MKNVYLDYTSASPVDPRVLMFAVKYASEEYGNPSSMHSMGVNAKQALEDARRKVSSLINAESPASILFTATATESNNLAIRGTAIRNKKTGQKIVSSTIEHMSVINPMKELAKSGYQYTTVPVDKHGIVNLDELAQAVTQDTVVTSINYANNEIGTIEPIREISRIVHENGNYLHVNATAVAGKIPIDVQKDGIDLLTISSNDFYGPRGAAALYVRKGVKIQTILPGGGQESGLRSGTENLFAITGMGVAAAIAEQSIPREGRFFDRIAEQLKREILLIPDSFLTGHPTQRLPGHISLHFNRIEGESILLNLDTNYGIQIATGSACTSRTLEPSHVLLAIGLKHEESHGSVVMSIGRLNDLEEVPYVVNAMIETVERLRALSPL